MLSTFDLTLMGSLVSAGGLLFLLKAKRPHLGWTWFTERQSVNQRSTSESCDRLERSSAIAGARWLAVGALTLLVAYLHGAEDGYLFGPWSDVTFHVIFVSACWGTTAYRMNQSAERPPDHINDDPVSTLSLPDTVHSQTTD